MGGMYSPLIHGEIDGLKIGIDTTTMTLWEHSKALDFNELGGEYLIGFGVGFAKAQHIREKLQVSGHNLDFEEKVRLYKYLVTTHADNYGPFVKMSRAFLDNIDSWGNEIIPVKVREEVLSLLKEQKLQRAIDKIDQFNYEHFRMALIIKYSELKTLLPKLRERKKKNQINAQQYQILKRDIENRLIAWIDKREASYL